jgi:hypothetical protein
MLETLTAEEMVPRAVMQPLVDNLSRTIHNRRLDQSALDEIERVIADHTVRIRLAGYLRFPTLKVVYFEEVGHITVVRADLEPAGVHRMVQNVIRQFGARLTVPGLIRAVSRAFPHFNKDDTGEKSEKAQKVIAEGKDHVTWGTSSEKPN